MLWDTLRDFCRSIKNMKSVDGNALITLDEVHLIQFVLKKDVKDTTHQVINVFMVAGMRPILINNMNHYTIEPYD